MIFQPATAELWKDMERLFGEHGACGGASRERSSRSSRGLKTGRL